MPKRARPLPHSQTHHPAFAATCICGPSPRARHRRPYHSTAPGTSQPGYHRALSPHCHQQGVLKYQSARSTPASHSYRDETGDSTVLLRADRWIVPNWKSPTCFVATWSDLSRDAPLLAEGYPAFDPSPWIRHVAAASGTGRAVVVVANDPLAQEGVRCLLRMRFLFKLLSSAAMAIFSLQMLWAQDLAPRAYIITSLHSNAITLTWSFCDGG